MDRERNQEPEFEAMELVEPEVDDDDRDEVPSESPPPDHSPPGEQKPVDIELLSFDSKGRDRWSSPTFSRGCLSIGCGLAIVVLVAIFMAGHSSLKKSVWLSFDRNCQRVASSLPFDLSQARRAALKEDMKAFAAYLQSLDDPYPVMGEFTTEVSNGFRDGLLSVRDVEKIEAVLHRYLPGEGAVDAAPADEPDTPIPADPSPEATATP